jgi:hypothetical protein
MNKKILEDKFYLFFFFEGFNVCSIFNKNIQFFFTNNNNFINKGT